MPPPSSLTSKIKSVQSGLETFVVSSIVIIEEFERPMSGLQTSKHAILKTPIKVQFQNKI